MLEAYTGALSLIVNQLWSRVFLRSQVQINSAQARDPAPRTGRATFIAFRLSRGRVVWSQALFVRQASQVAACVNPTRPTYPSAVIEKNG